MFDFDRWQTENEQYLSRSLDRLRARLQSLASDSIKPEPKTSVTNDRSTDENLSTDDSREFPISDGEYQPALEVVASRFGLSTFEKQVLLLCAATEFDTRMPNLFAQAQDDLTKVYPTFALCLTLFDEPAWDVVSPQRPLRKYRLIEIDRHATIPLSASPIRACDRIVSFLKGLNHLDEHLDLLMQPIDATPSTLPVSQQRLVDEMLIAINDSDAGSRLPIVQLLGTDHDTKRKIASHVCGSLDASLYRLSADLIPSSIDQLDELARLWQRECNLVPLALYVDAAEHADAATIRNVQRLLARITGIVFCDLLDRQRISEHDLVLDVAKPTASEQKQSWSQHLPDVDDATVSLLAGQFDLNIASIERIAEQAIQLTDADASIDSGEDSEFTLNSELWNGCRQVTRPKLDELAQRIDAKATWDDIVLPPEELTLLRQVTAQVQHRGKVLDDWGFRDKVNRGLGVTTLFAGESGTGKTMAAEVIANDLQLDLYRIDLSQVINKYIGETEKNLRKLFDAAENGGVILFFDEADALFGKRSEVKDSHDRFANIEVNYLLQRMESYRGLAILATNNKRALDTAFIRRLRFIVEFQFPEIKQRKQIWQRIFPSSTPLSNIDYNHLAKLRLTGGNIYNIALNAAFTAASDRPAIDMLSILNAAKAEMIKSQKPVNSNELQWNTPQEVLA